MGFFKFQPKTLALTLRASRQTLCILQLCHFSFPPIALFLLMFTIFVIKLKRSVGYNTHLLLVCCHTGSTQLIFCARLASSMRFQFKQTKLAQESQRKDAVHYARRWDQVTFWTHLAGCESKQEPSNSFKKDTIRGRLPAIRNVFKRFEAKAACFLHVVRCRRHQKIFCVELGALLLWLFSIFNAKRRTCRQREGCSGGLSGFNCSVAG